ncbi:MAG: GAF domain-containing protein, partial [Bacteroidales bacterium]|nr:GAF domain-containing protein [Bacteroidales bacterium]
TLNRQLLILFATIVLLSIIISYFLLRAVRTPIDELINATQRFHNGDMNARSLNISNNEFGMLSASFNTLADGIQVKSDIDERFANLASLMLCEYDVKKFFQSTLNALAVHTGSQMSAIYLLSDDKKTFDHFESIGMDKTARLSFEADKFEGEFGAALSTRKIQHIKSIPEDTRFVFHAVSVKFIPREIITIPIIADNEVVAVISLASINEYSKPYIQLINNIFVTLCARVEGILAYHKMKVFSKILEAQKDEMEAQKNEMEAQKNEM